MSKTDSLIFNVLSYHTPNKFEDLDNVYVREKKIKVQKMYISIYPKYLVTDALQQEKNNKTLKNCRWYCRWWQHIRHVSLSHPNIRSVTDRFKFQPQFKLWLCSVIFSPRSWLPKPIIVSYSFRIHLSRDFSQFYPRSQVWSLITIPI